MPLYLTKFSYTPATWARLIAHPEDRRKSAQSYIESVGGKLHGFWYAFGDHDGYNLWEAPDNVSMAATALVAWLVVWPSPPASEDVAAATRIVTVPINPEFGSLNLAQAVIVLAYEWSRQSALAQPPALDAVTAAVGLGLALLVSRVGQHRVRLVAPWAYAGSVLLLLAVLTPLGRTVNGSRSWIPLVGGFTVQPAELVTLGDHLGQLFITPSRISPAAWSHRSGTVPPPPCHWSPRVPPG